MKISFDLDGTLIPLGTGGFPVERKTRLQKVLKVEPLRAGTISLFKALKAAGYEVGIYTTSFRSQRMIRLWLWAYGIKADFIINEQIAGPILRLDQISASKFPPAFNIDLHIDDLPGIAMEGERFGFQILLLAPETQNLSGVLEQIQLFDNKRSVPSLQ